MKIEAKITATGSVMVSLAMAVLLASPAMGQPASRPEVEELAMARQAELVEADRVLADPTADGRLGAINTLVHIASSYPALPDEVRTLLIRATGDADLDIARLAERALFNHEQRGKDHDPSVSEEVERKRSQRGDLDQARQALAGQGMDPSRLGAVQTLVHLVSPGVASPEVAADVVTLLEELTGDDDFDIANLAERALANREGRPMDPALVRPAVASHESERLSVEEPDHFAALTADRAGARLAALEMILEAALSDNRRDDPKVIDAFVKLLADPDSRVAYRAGNALAGLAGHENALGNVYVGGVVESVAGEPQSEAPADHASPASIGYVDEYGVFIGTVQQAIGGDEQPPSAAKDESLQPAGSVDEYGVFIGVVQDSGEAGEQQP